MSKPRGEGENSNPITVKSWFGNDNNILGAGPGAQAVIYALVSVGECYYHHHLSACGHRLTFAARCMPDTKLLTRRLRLETFASGRLPRDFCMTFRIR